METEAVLYAALAKRLNVGRIVQHGRRNVRTDAGDVKTNLFVRVELAVRGHKRDAVVLGDVQFTTCEACARDDVEAAAGIHEPSRDIDGTCAYNWHCWQDRNLRVVVGAVDKVKVPVHQQDWVTAERGSFQGSYLKSIASACHWLESKCKRKSADVGTAPQW